MTGGIIFLVMIVLVFLIVLGSYWTWYEFNPTTEEIIQEAIDKQNV